MRVHRSVTKIAAAALLFNFGCQSPQQNDEKPETSEKPVEVDESDSDTSANGNDDDSAPQDSDFPSGDLPGGGSTDTSPGGEGDKELRYSYIWIANSLEGTVSKINTRTMKEEGRYQTRPDRLGSPSRTSVGISGDVVVANRGGGIAKFYADKKDCVDRNGDGVIQTSTGSKNVLDWEEDECLAWYNAMTYGSQRVVAWTYEQGEVGPDGGTPDIVENVWVTGIHEIDPRIHVHLLDGKTGEILKSTTVIDVPVAFPYGAYGGAVDGNNDLWFSNSHNPVGKLVRVSYKDMTVKSWDRPFQSYGITVDPKGRPWVCGVSVARFDPKEEKWNPVLLPPGRVGVLGGCMVDGKNRLWFDVTVTGLPTVTGIDIDTLKVTDTIILPEHPHGVSIDFDGNVWGVGLSSTNAYRINPDSKKIDVFSGLFMAYTYSDMTGFALDSVQEDPPV